MTMNKKITQEQRDAAVKLAAKMAKAAGKVPPVVMVMACGMLVETAWMSEDKDSYIDWRIAKAQQ